MGSNTKDGEQYASSVEKAFQDSTTKLEVSAKAKFTSKEETPTELQRKLEILQESNVDLSAHLKEAQTLTVELQLKIGTLEEENTQLQQKLDERIVDQFEMRPQITH